MWTKFWDRHSGGGAKEKWSLIFIEAPEQEAKVIFQNRFGHNPERVSCTCCCGDDYSIREDESLDQLTAYHRHCEVEENKYVERGGADYTTPAQYAKNKDVLIIRASKIKDSEREGELRQQGYMYVD